MDRSGFASEWSHRERGRLDAIPVFYSPEQVAEPQGASPSASKPRQVLESWRARGLPIACCHARCGEVVPPSAPNMKTFFHIGFFYKACFNLIWILKARFQ